MALAGEREDQRQARVRRFPHHTAVGTDCRPLYFKVRSDKWRLVTCVEVLGFFLILF